MAEAYVSLKKKRLLEKRKVIEQSKKDKLKKRLFCDEKVPIESYFEDLEVDPKSRDIRSFFKKPTERTQAYRIIVFNGAKKPDDKQYYCVACFEEKYQEYVDNDSQYLFEGTRKYEVTFQPTLDEYCCACQKALYKIVYKSKPVQF